MAAASTAACATAAFAENPLFPVAAAGAAAAGLPAITADGRAASAARQPAPLQVAPVAATLREVRLSATPLPSASRLRWGWVPKRRQGTHISLRPPHRRQRKAGTRHRGGGFAARPLVVTPAVE